MDDLLPSCPLCLAGTEHKVLVGPTCGMLWDGTKIGAGTQPMKTRYGWLLLTHGASICPFPSIFKMPWR